MGFRFDDYIGNNNSSGGGYKRGVESFEANTSSQPVAEDANSHLRTLSLEDLYFLQAVGARIKPKWLKRLKYSGNLSSISR